LRERIISSTTVLSFSCLEGEDHEFYHCFQDKTVVELMILYPQDKNRIKQW
jgi:hypothetical protein